MANPPTLRDVAGGIPARLLSQSSPGAMAPTRTDAPISRRKLLRPRSRRDVLAYFGGLGAISAIALIGRLTSRPTAVVPVSAVTQPHSGASPTASARPAIPPPSATATATMTPSVAALAANHESMSTTTNAGAGALEATTVPAESTATATAKATSTSTATTVAPPFGDVLGTSTISYAGAVPGRATNIELAARRIDGVTLEPGATFSFLDHLGPQTFAAGFRIGYGIVLVDGAPRTAPLIGGGICDVSTILFQAAFRAGLGIVERHYHSLWIEHYGKPPFGAIGLDATVDVQPVDFKFQNTTPNPLTIVCQYRDAAVSLELRGTDPGWTVTIGHPFVSHTVNAAMTIVRQPDPTLPVGSEVVIETAKPGFDVSWDRRITAGDQLVDEYRFTNHYLPSRNIVSVGTKGATPTPTSTPSPTAVRLPKGTADPTGTPTSADLLAVEVVRVPSLVGLLEIQAKPLIAQAGLTITPSNYQGEGDLPAAALTVGIGSVLSQIPAPGALVLKGSKIFLAVRKN